MKPTECRKLVQLGEMPNMNFFQYPPPVAASRREKEAFLEKLDLSKPLRESDTFTMFISVPYCRHRCNSCTYFKGLLPEVADKEAFLEPYVKAMESQIASYSEANRFGSAKCGAIYMGGGTASLLSADQAARLVSLILKSFNTDRTTEITLEANPLDLDTVYLRKVVQVGVNRLSVGYQSARPSVLENIGTSHDAAASRRSIKSALGAGFRTVNVDLLYGVPGQTFGDWKGDLAYIASTSPESITTNSYIVHESTWSQSMIRQGKLKKPVTHEERTRWEAYADRVFSEAGYEKDRAGHFSKRGHGQRYSELTYAHGAECIPIGAGAYGFINRYIFKATNNAEDYMRNVSAGVFLSPDFLSIKADERTMMERYVIQHLSGRQLSISAFRDIFGREPVEAFPEVFAELQRENLASFDENTISLTQHGERWRENVLFAFTSEKLRQDMLRR